MGDTAEILRLADDGCPHAAIEEPTAPPAPTGDEIRELERWANAMKAAGSRTARITLTLLGAYRRQAIELAQLKQVRA